MSYVGNGHVIRTFQGIEPAQISIERSGPESLRIEFLQVAVNFLGATQKFFAGPEKIAVVTEVVDINLAAALSYPLEKRRRHVITFFGHHLIRGFEPKFVVGIHQLRAKISSRLSLNVVGQNGSRRSSFRPEPDQRYGRVI